MLDKPDDLETTSRDTLAAMKKQLTASNVLPARDLLKNLEAFRDERPIPSSYLDQYTEIRLEYVTLMCEILLAVAANDMNEWEWKFTYELYDETRVTEKQLIKLEEIYDRHIKE